MEPLTPNDRIEFIVSVIIPCYNQTHYLPTTVESVIKQSFTDWEIIIVNNSGSDDTRAVFQQLVRYWPKHVFRYLETMTGGIADMRNAGIAIARGKYILPLNADDTLHPETLLKTVLLLEKNPDISIVHTNIRCFGSNILVRAAKFIFAILFQRNQLNYCSLYCRDVWTAVGGYRTNKRNIENRDFWVRCSRLGFKSKYIQKSLLNYRIKKRSRHTIPASHQSTLAFYDTNASPVSPLVSVIITTYNRPEYLVEAVRSVLDQTFTNFEIVVVNDGGCDVETTLAQFNSKSMIVFRHEINQGIAAARKTGIRSARGKYVTYLDDDGIYYPEHLQTLVDYLAMHPGIVAYTKACCSQLALRNGKWQVIGCQVPHLYDWSNDRILTENFVHTLCFMHEKAFLEKAGYFDETLNCHTDWDLWIRLSRHYPFVQLPQVTCEFKQCSNTSSMIRQDPNQILEAMQQIQSKYAEFAARRPELLKYQKIKQEDLQELVQCQSKTPKFRVGTFILDSRIRASPYLRLIAPLNRLQDCHEIEHLFVCNLINKRPIIDFKLMSMSQILVVQRTAVHLPYHTLRNAYPNMKIVFELDDALTLFPKTYKVHQYLRPLIPHIEEYLKNADLVTVSTPKLKELYSHFNDHIEVLPNLLDTRIWLSPEPKCSENKKFTIFFGGTISHQHDVALLEEVIEQIICEFPERVEFLFWGDSPSGMKKYPQVKIRPVFINDYTVYAQELLSLPVDLALVPLELHTFNRAKSAIKWIEYSACKIPGIFSDIEAYNQIVEHGKTGWLVPNTKEAWYNAIKTHILNDRLRLSIAENAHQMVLAKHTLNQNARRWLEVYERLLV